MANKVSMSGIVEQVSDNGFKMNGTWFNKARTADKYTAPSVGQTVTFDAYGQQNNLVYSVKAEGNGNGPSNGNVDHANGSNNLTSGHVDRRELISVSHRSQALAAAATLLSGSDGDVQQVASNVVVIAQIFQAWLEGKSPVEEELPL